ncbi:MAG: RagB/SusD family nutrient uptake outer membrane protein [Prolixibacteraceae bacterium]|nr:RagB/SusD family nutrient uptake outer membrane protein [Prolixibacteraceae bacterium]
MKRFRPFILLLLPFTIACSESFLDIKPDKKLVVPSTLNDLQGLLDYFDVHNSNMPGMGELSSDDYYILYDRWNTLSPPYLKNGYVWAKEIWEGSSSIDWNYRYQQIFYANYVLEGLEKLNRADNQPDYDRLKGTALFHRAHALYQLTQEFCAPYNQSESGNAYGLPLRLTSDLNVHTDRATVKETYERIVADLLDAINYLPENDPYKTRPVKAAANTLLSRTYLIMQEYEKALLYAEAVLGAGYKLIDFNSLKASAAYPMERFNSEVIFHSQMTQFTPLSSSRLIMDTTLYRSYANDDIRKAAWFKPASGGYTFKGSYCGSQQTFNGIAVDECYLTKAECLARNGSIEEAINTLNKLLVTRYKTGSYTPVSVTSQQQALTMILKERRKELLFRGIRWSDLRRLNLDASTATTIYRNLNGTRYKLEPNSPNYTLPVADDVIQLSKIPQNIRE